jgi:hypothetical protein
MILPGDETDVGAGRQEIPNVSSPFPHEYGHLESWTEIRQLLQDPVNVAPHTFVLRRKMSPVHEELDAPHWRTNRSGLYGIRQGDSSLSERRNSRLFSNVFFNRSMQGDGLRSGFFSRGSRDVASTIALKLFEF